MDDRRRSRSLVGRSQRITDTFESGIFREFSKLEENGRGIYECGEPDPKRCSGRAGKSYIKCSSLRHEVPSIVHVKQGPDLTDLQWLMFKEMERMPLGQ